VNFNLNQRFYFAPSMLLPVALLTRICWEAWRKLCCQCCGWTV